MLCTTERAANFGAQLYFSEKITFIEPHGKAHINTMTAAVVGIIGTRRYRINMARRASPGMITNRINEVTYAFTSLITLRNGKVAIDEPMIIMESGIVIAPISATGSAMISGKRKGEMNSAIAATDAIVTGFRIN